MIKQIYLFSAKVIPWYYSSYSPYLIQSYTVTPHITLLRVLLE